MKTYTITIIFTCLLIVACKTTSDKTDKTSPGDTIIPDKATVDSSTVQPLDTTILLTSLTESNYTGQNLTSTYAKKILYSYFESKGYYTSDNLPDIGKLTDLDNDKLSVAYDTIFTVDLNNNKNTDAIITYWLTPPYSSGHYWQPHKAIVIDTETGYQITNEDFIPDNFAIDSVVTQKHNVTIIGYDYDCRNHKVLRNFRAVIK